MKVKETFCTAGLYISRAFSVLRLIFYLSGAVDDLWAADLNLSRRYWFPRVFAVLPLMPLSVAAFGLVSPRTSWMLEITTHLYSQVVIATYTLGLKFTNMRRWMDSCFPTMILEFVRLLLEAAGAMPRLPFHTRSAHLVLYIAACLRSIPSNEMLTLLPGMFVFFSTTFSVMALLQFAVNSVFRVMCDLEDSKSLIQQQRDVYMGLLENATDGCCSFEDHAPEGPQLVRVSKKLQSLLSVNMDSITVGDVVGSASDMDCLLSLARTESPLSASLPTIITCKSGSPTDYDALEFEVRIWAFRPPEGEIKLCFQLASEKRMLVLSKAPPQPNNVLQLDVAGHDELEVGSATSFNIEPSTSSLAFTQSSLGSLSSTKKHSVSIGTQTLGANKPPETPDSNISAVRGYRAAIRLNTRKLAQRGYAETPLTTVKWLVCEVLAKCNVRGKGCCTWHVCLQVLRKNLEEFAKGTCKCGFSMNSKWQCRACLCLHEDEESDDDDEPMRVCSVCRCEQTERDEDSVSAGNGNSASSCGADVESGLLEKNSQPDLQNS